MATGSGVPQPTSQSKKRRSDDGRREDRINQQNVFTTIACCRGWKEVMNNHRNNQTEEGRKTGNKERRENRNCRPANEQANHPTKDGRGGEGGGWQEGGTDRTTLG